MFNIVKRQDFMLGQDAPTWQEAEDLRLEKYGRDHIVIIRADTEKAYQLTGIMLNNVRLVNAFGAGVLRDRYNLKFLAGCIDNIADGFAHQRPCHWGYEGNRAGLRVRFVLSHDMIFLHAPIVTPEGHRTPKGYRVS
jgi:hypothetical protein